MGLFSKKKKEEKKDEQVKKPAEVKVEKTKVQKNNKAKKQDNKEKKKNTAEIKHDHGEAHKYIIRPLITEKASFLGMNNQYVFEVAPRANKIEINKAIEKLYGVKPIKINILKVSGKRVRYGRSWGKQRSWKKAIVTLKQGDKIEVYEGV